jgi:O-acetyl-ADP-ribose deacetylase (regulator of RNase III)
MNKSRIVKTFLSEQVSVLRGNITDQHVDAIVNAANSTLLGGGGVDGAIHSKGGPEILRACEELRRTRFPKGLPTGEAVMTTGGLLPARYVIHTVGPICRLGQKPDASMLASCYRNSLALAAEKDLHSIAFPAISTGAFGYPHEQAASVVSETIQCFLREKTSVERIVLVFFEANDVTLFLKHHKFAAS